MRPASWRSDAEKLGVFLRCNTSLLAQSDRYCAATECPLLGGIADIPAYLFRRRLLDKRLCSGYTIILAPVKDMARRHTASWERGRCPRVGLQPAPGRLGHQSPGIMTGMGGASLDWDRRRRVTPVQTASQEAWPEAEPWGRILPTGREPRWNADKRARSKRARAASQDAAVADPAFAGVPLPSFSS